MDSFPDVLERAFPKDDTELEINRTDQWDHAFVGNINGDDVQYAIRKIDTVEDVTFAVTETGSGLGMEVWTIDDAT